MQKTTVGSEIIGPSNFQSQETLRGQALSAYQCPSQITATTPGINNLGLGINAASGSYLGGYLEQIVDLKKLVGVAQITSLNRFVSNCIAEKDCQSYLTEQTAEVGITGGYAGFSASVQTSFGESTSKSSTNAFATYSQIIELYQLVIPVGQRCQILTDSFKDALYNMDPNEFYAKYGAYFTSTCVVGGSLSASVQTSASSYSNQTTFSINAKASYDSGIAHGSVNSSYTYKDTVTQTTYQCNTGIVMMGGDYTTAEGKAIDVMAWSQSVANNPAVVGWGFLTPMWQLVENNPARVAELKGAIDAYFDQPNPYLIAPLTLKTFSSTSAISTGPQTATVTVDPGYKVLCGGASLSQDNVDNQFLTACNVISSGTPNQWTASSKSFWNVTSASLTAYAVAVYDPHDLLDVRVFNTTTTNAVPHPDASVKIDSGYVLTGGGISTNPTNADGSALVGSFPTDSQTWRGMSKDHYASCPATISVNAIGIKWRNPTGKPAIKCEITSSPSPMSGQPNQTVSAGGNCSLVGGGAYDNYGNGPGNMLQDCCPVQNQRGQTISWSAQGHDCKSENAATLTTYCIGLKVVWQNKDGSQTEEPFGPGCLTENQAH